MRSYTYVTDTDLERCEEIRARGILQPSSSFVLKPVFQSDGSVVFRHSMLLPFFGWIFAAVACIVVWFELMRRGITTSAIPSVFWLGGASAGFLIAAIFTRLHDRVLTVFPDGSSLGSRRRLLIRRHIKGTPARTRLLRGLAYSKTDRIGRLSNLVSKLPSLNTGRPLYSANSCLLVVVDGVPFPVGIGRLEQLNVIESLLTNDYGLKTEPRVVLYRFKGFV